MPVHRAVVVDRIDEGGIDMVGEFQATSRLEVDGVVLVTQRLSDDALYRELAGDPAALEAAGIEAVYRIGDCVAPRLIADAIFDGHRLAREIDSPDPERPLPYLRERPLMAGTPASADPSRTCHGLATPRPAGAVSNTETAAVAEVGSRRGERDRSVTVRRWVSPAA